MELFALGSNGAGQLGIGSIEDVWDPTQCHIINQSGYDLGLAKKVTAGGNHALILFSSGKVLIAGAYQDRQCSTSNLSLFSLLSVSSQGEDSKSITSKAKFCSATWSASVIVTTDDRIFTYGKGDKGELGQGTQVTESDSTCQPLELSESIFRETTIVDLASGVHHSVIVLSNGDVYGWGNGRKGQLGEPTDVLWLPRKIVGLDFPVSRAVCGREFTYLVGSPQKGHHAVLGADKWKVRTNAPKLILSWSDIGASWGSIFVLDQAGRITSWGRNDHGQLAPTCLPAVKQMAIGSEHAIALTAQGKIIAWGWGEHGNCGAGVDQDGDIKPRWNELSLLFPMPHNSFSGVGAGSATSWIWTST